MSEVKLFKKKGTYVGKQDGETMYYTNFYVRCGDELIPVEVSNFSTPEKKDLQYAPRRAVLSAFAETLPAKPKKEGSATSAAKSNLKPLNDNESDPF